MPAARDLLPRLRLASGLVLFAFLTSHLLNHTLGLVSVEAMEAGRRVFALVWQTPPATLLLYAALLGHVVFALTRIAGRRSFRMAPWEVAQTLLGLLIPFLLIEHVVGTRGAFQVLGARVDYPVVLDALWPDQALGQSVLVIVAWLHGCLGIHFWLRLRPWYPRIRPILFAFALLLPTLALVGFVDGGRAVATAAAPVAGAGDSAIDRAAWVDRNATRIEFAFAAALGLVALLHAFRALWSRRHGRVRVRYPDGTRVTLGPGMSVLEGSRSAGIPHASVCGGRGRCSTCRVRITAGGEALPPPSPNEQRVLARVGAGVEIRLACQLRPVQDLSIIPLLPPGATPRDARTRVDPSQGVERVIAVLFADLRGFTQMAEGRLPYDVVFILNQYFRAMGEAIGGAGGHVDKFIGDGIMALFGLETSPEVACQRALAGAQAMAEALQILNERLTGELPSPLRMGIGLHAGPVILGEMGHAEATSLTAIGDTVNVASRLEALTKDYGVELVVSADVAEQAGVDLVRFECREVEIRGRRRPLRIHLVASARDLPVAETAAESPPRALWRGLVPFLEPRRRPPDHSAA